MTAMKEIPPQAVSFRLLFSDGEQEIQFGEVAVDPGLVFSKFQFLISDMIGVAPHQITLYLVRQKKARPSSEGRRKMLIDEGTDFGALVRERDCAVLARLKRTRKDRRGRARRNHAIGGGGGGGGGEEFFALERKQTPLPEKTILRRPAEFYRGAPALAAMVPASGVAEDGAGLMGLFNYEGLMNLQLQRERYLLSTAAAAYNSYAAVPPPHAGGARRVAGHGDALFDAAGAALCAVCVAARGKPVPFHCCVYDRVVAEGFRSSVGPIERPSKARVQTAA